MRVAAPDVVVSYQRNQWYRQIGESLTIGRSQECDVRLPDPEISRHACLLRVDSGFVMVFNQSRNKPLVLRPPVGEDRRLSPSAATASLPHPVFDVVFAGHDDHPVAVRVDAYRLTPPLPPSAEESEGRTRGADEPDLAAPRRPSLGGLRAARMQAALLTPAQRIAVTALCEPMLTRNGRLARPLSSAELAQRLGWRPDYARNVIKEARHRLSDAGVSGLVDDAAAGRTDLRLALARWAIEFGAVSEHDLAALPSCSGVAR
jgi:hypothetical protein